MDKVAVVTHILKNLSKEPKQGQGSAFAPANIALCKYWGKRNQELNLPVTGSLSISLGTLGAKTTIKLKEDPRDCILVNGEKAKTDSAFAINLINFLNLFRPNSDVGFEVVTDVNIPIGAGLASSAAGFAAAVAALNQLFNWQLSSTHLSILARLGSGSASRSFWHGFVEWHVGIREDGMDCFAAPLSYHWPSLRIGLLMINSKQKTISSREAMRITSLSSPFYSVWPIKHAEDLKRLKKAIDCQSFEDLGEVSESNALMMHALMLTATPSILYSEPSTIAAIQKIWHCRQTGLPIYFTQDAGPNLKLLFREQDVNEVVATFPGLKIIAPFDQENQND